MEKYKKLLESWPKKWMSRRALEHPDLLSYLDGRYPEVELAIQIQSFLHDTSPYCVVCGKPVKLYGKQTCSIECRSAAAKNYQTTRVEKYKKTMIERYGVDNPRNIEGMDDRIKNTMMDKYGALVSPKSLTSIKNRTADLQVKGKQTLLDRYGVDNPSKLPDHNDKVKTTLSNHYGVDHYFKSEEFKSKSEAKRLEKYSHICPPEISITNIAEAIDKKDFFNDPNKIIDFTCGKCASNESLPTETFKWRIRECGTPCSKCSNISKNSSLKEFEVYNFITNDLKLHADRNIRILPDGREIDIFIPELKLGIEFDGLYWHNDLRLEKNYHKNKTELANSIGIKLIHIFEDEWEHNREIVKSRLSSLAGKISRRIYARNCTVKEISTNDERTFLNENHIQGWHRSRVKLGLYNKGKLVSVMTFSGLSRAKGHKAVAGHWELLRFCSIKNMVVIGGASRLFKYFTKHYNPIHILSFADSRWSHGNLYTQLGFTAAGHTGANYWYIDAKKGKRIHRFALRKQASDDQNLTEYENRLNQGYLRIWDCGSSKWIWKKEP